ncbi:MAG: diaminobutyrate acetyltransferase [Paraperlucidibaca sp.]
MTSALKTPIVAAHTLALRQPEQADGLRVFELIEQSPPLDLNSCYSYLLHSWHFAETCILAEEGDILAGYISGYIPPKQHDTLFVWQVVCAERYRGTGLALTLLAGLLARPSCRDVSFLETTVSPSNTASARLFTKLAERLNCPLTISTKFNAELFGTQGHEPEQLFRIGPFPAPLADSLHNQLEK